MSTPAPQTRRPLPLSGLDTTTVAPDVLERLAAFRNNWLGKVGNEQQLAQSFLNDLCDALGTPKPNDGAFAEEAYQFEKPVSGGGERGRIDLYKRDHFVLEAKCGRASSKETGSAPVRGTKAYQRYIEGAFLDQARIYTARLPEGPPPLAIVVDVGARFWVWRYDGSSYGGFHSPRRVDIPLELVADEDYARVLLACFEAPRTLDPSLEQERITRDAAERLAELAATLEAKHSSEDIAKFLMRCLFCMFAEDAGLITPNTFTNLLRKTSQRPEAFEGAVTQFFGVMDRGGYSDLERIRRFNGALFKDARALPLAPEPIAALAEAAELRWDQVDPSIFGTLLERALDPIERRRLGAHYTPRAYVERLVHPTLEAPLRREWEIVQVQVDEVLGDEKVDEKKRPAKAAAFIERYIDRLSRVRVLDPACGTGNFLYVSYAVVKGLEHEALEALHQLTGKAQEGLALEGGKTVVPSHFLGLEVKPWAAEIAQLVLWIGHLQWEIGHGRLSVLREPILGEERSITCRDAVLDYDGTTPNLDSDGKPLARWDMRTTTRDPSTGAEVPDLNATIPDVRYENPRPATWPGAEFIVGNPPFLGNKVMRMHLGDGYVEALRAAYPDTPGSVDYVMYWWERAAAQVAEGQVERAGLITTNSITQSFNRAVVAGALSAKKPASLDFAIPDHPWVDGSSGAAVRIAMSVVVPGEVDGRTLLVESERPSDEGYIVPTFSERAGRVHANLRVGPNVSGATPLQANEELSFMGVTLVGQGFVVEPDDELNAIEPGALKPYLVGAELNRVPKNRSVIDFYGLTEGEARARFPHAFQRVQDTVRPQRSGQKRTSYRTLWWVHAEPRSRMRAALEGLPRFVGICRTAKHFIFQFVPGGTLLESTGIAIASGDAAWLGILSSRVHITWAESIGSRMGVGNDLRYNNKRCFETFPFPDLAHSSIERLRELGEELDAHRKRALAADPKLKLTDVYNVLAKVRASEPLSDKERGIYDRALVGLLNELHDRLDAAALEAYGWPADLDDEALLTRLVALNKERASEEAAGKVRWLREPADAKQTALAGTEKAAPTKAAKKSKVKQLPWPSESADQMFAILDVLTAADGSMTVEAVAGRFKRARREKVREHLERFAKRRMVTKDNENAYAHIALG